MKITKNRLIEIIKEEMEKLSTEPPATGFGRGSTSASQAKQSFRDTGDSITDPEVTGKERQIMNQMKDMIEQAAKELDIGSGNSYAVLQKVYKLLGKAIEQDGQKNEQ